ncbi:aldehyde dehydrogenase family protein [Nocardia fluminea]|jgi:acyl-CoA reductase-like NAD-dependent aldehyde dehydrogenase|uniref:aldehyde dehydrogenase family protein n=2 Tax=Nocardiaceae TaxID=85025 RepID=UPI000AD12F67
MVTAIDIESGSLDQAVSDLTAGSARWAHLRLGERATLLRACHAATAAQAATWAKVACQAKNVPSGPLEGEEWMSGPAATLQALATLGTSLEAIAAGRSPIEGRRIGHAPGNRTTIGVLPTDAKEWLLLNGFKADVWLKPGVHAQQTTERAGLGQHELGVDGGVGLVLGAGNITSIAPLDVLYELIAFNRASILKLNPTFGALKLVYEAALAPLIEFGVLRIVNGGAETGGYLADHPGISHVHITGSVVTHDLVVWGSGEEAAERRATGEPRLKKEMTSELGGVSPIIVVPGRWSERDLRYQAEHVATMRLHNAGHNCVAGQTLILSSDWPQREAFLGELARVLDGLEARESWYPGSADRIESAVQTHHAAQGHGDCVLIEANGEDDPLFTTEYFVGVLGHTCLPGVGATFLRNAVAFANDRLIGTLGANVLVRPRDRKAMGREFDEAIADLRYGGIAINAGPDSFSSWRAPRGARSRGTRSKRSAAGSGSSTMRSSSMRSSVWSRQDHSGHSLVRW